ncbi:MAG: hypothetical protein AAF902_02335 [Chloroflexota bacterium]
MESVVNFLGAAITYFEGVYTSTLPEATAGQTIYAVVAILSIFSALLGLGMVVFRRADGLAVNSLIAQAVVVVLAPALYVAFFGVG